MKTNLTITSILIICGFLFCSCDRFTPTELTTTSPKGTYEVHMVEKEENNKYIVNFSANKQNKTFIKDKNFYYDSGFFSAGFISYGVEPNWIMENVLTFGILDSSIIPDQISITNETEKVVSYLKITARGRYLLFELEPHSQTKLKISPQTDKSADISWIDVGGMFDDGQKIPGTGMDFRIRGKYVPPAHYCVSIRENEVLIQSKDFEGFFEKDMPEARNPSCE